MRSEEEIKEEIENIEFLKKIKKRAAKIILHECFDYIEIMDAQYSLLRLIAEAKRYNDLPNIRIEPLLDQIEERLKR